MRGLAAKAKALGLQPGWYGNNCVCKETRPACALHDGESACFAGDVNATIDFGFETIKVDGCGIEKNVSHFAALFNATGKAVLIEDCGNGVPLKAYRDAGKLVCPMNMYRSSSDLHPVWHSVLNNLNSTRLYNGAHLSIPGCWGERIDSAMLAFLVCQISNDTCCRSLSRQ